MDYLERIERELDLPPGEKAEVMRELRSHYEELVSELVSSGMEQRQAEDEAARRMGEPAEVAAQTASVPRRAPWESVLLAVVPLVLAACVLVLQTSPFAERPGATAGRFALLSAFTALVVVGTVRELKHNRRPAWLPVWFAAVLLLAGPLARSFVLLFPAAKAIHVELARALVAFAVITAVGIWSVWTAPRWRALVIAAQVCFAAMLVVFIDLLEPGWIPSFASTMVLTVLPFLVGAVTTTAIGLRIFALHRSGNIAQASLFFFALTQLDVGRHIYLTQLDVGTHIYRTGHWDFHFAVHYWAPVLVPMVAVAAYARVADWRMKLLALSAGVVLAATLPLATGGPDFDMVIDGLVSAALDLALVALVPVVFSRLQSGGRPAVV